MTGLDLKQAFGSPAHNGCLAPGADIVTANHLSRARSRPSGYEGRPIVKIPALFQLVRHHFEPRNAWKPFKMLGSAASYALLALKRSSPIRSGMYARARHKVSCSPRKLKRSIHSVDIALKSVG